MSLPRLLLFLHAAAIVLLVALFVRSKEAAAPPVGARPPIHGGGGERPPGVDPSSRGPVRLVDVAEKAGIDFVHRNGREGTATILEMAGPGIGLFDVDGDGQLDIYCPQGSDVYGRKDESVRRNRLYRNRGGWRFEDVTESAGVGDTGYSNGCSIGDVDGDGLPDIYVANYGANTLYRNRGDFSFEDVTEATGVGHEAWGMSSAFADIDADGDLDLYLVNYVTYDPATSVRYCEVGRDAEGRPVMDACGPEAYPGSPDVLYRNDGGVFVDVTAEAGVLRRDGKGLVSMFADYDEDGDADLFVGNDNMEDFLFRNDGKGAFTDVALSLGVAYDFDHAPIATMTVDFADANGDGRLDLLVTNFQEKSNNLWLYDEDGFFENVSHLSGLGRTTTAYLGFGAQLFDHDCDGWPDIYVANGHVYSGVDRVTELEVTFLQKNQLFRNTGGGMFVEIDGGPGLEARFASRGAAFGDIDSDGDVDILVANNDDRPTLLRNEGGEHGRALLLSFVGVESNRLGLGVRATVRSGGHKQARETRSGGSYLSQGDLRLHFGLGDEERADVVEVRWPSGTRQTFEDLPADRWYEIREGAAEPRVVAPLRPDRAK